MKNRILIVNHGPAESLVRVCQKQAGTGAASGGTPLRTELIPPHAQQEVLFTPEQCLVVEGD